MAFWLIKSEPTTWSWAQQIEKGTESWDGVRNYQARNFMRDQMKKGDLVLFYHSNASGSKTELRRNNGDGTFTYVGRKASSTFSDAFIDNWLKKLSYGLWWKNPRTVGESAWISDIHVAFPKLIDDRLKQKSICQLDHNKFTSPEMLKLSESILSFYHVGAERLSALDGLFTLPHESLFIQNPEYRTILLQQINEMKANGLHVAAKYHPRNSDPDLLNLTKAGVDLLPAGVSFEAILPLLPTSTHIIGDLSSTLLIARWLRPELKVTSICSAEGNPDFIELFHSLDIEVNYV